MGKPGKEDKIRFLGSKHQWGRGRGKEGAWECHCETERWVE